MSYERPKLAEDFGRELVERLVNGLLEDQLKSWRGQWAAEGANATFRRLESLRFTPEQRQFAWGLVAAAIEGSYHAVVHLLDEKITLGEMAVELRAADGGGGGQAPLPFDGDVIGMPYGFSADMLERYGVDAKALYEAAQARPPLANGRTTSPGDAAGNWIDDLARSEGRCTECGRPPKALRRQCAKCGQAY